MTEKKKTTDALEIMHRRYYEGKPERLAELEQARAEDKAWRESLADEQSELDAQPASIVWVGDLKAGTKEIRQQVKASLAQSARELRADDMES